MNFLTYEYAFCTMSSMKRSGFKSGQPAPLSGQYELVGVRGGRKGKERIVVAGEPLPPTPEAGMTYKLVDVTKH